MIPRTYPSISEADELSPFYLPGKVVVFELTDTTGKVAWRDYIPAAVHPSPANANRNKTEDDGWMSFEILPSNAGKVEWVDYIPIDTVAYVAANAWKTDAAGFIPYKDQT